MKYRYAAVTDVGKREINEDSLLTMEGRYRLIAILLLHGQSPHQRVFLRRRDILHAQHRRPHQRVRIQPFRRRGRRYAGDQLVDRGRHRVYVGIGAILAVGGIHFHGRITRAHHQHAGFLFAVALHRAAEVDQLHRSGFRKHQVFRADVAVIG